MSNRNITTEKFEWKNALSECVVSRYNKMTGKKSLIEIFGIIYEVLSENVVIGLPPSSEYRDADIPDKSDIIRIFNPERNMWESPKLIFGTMLKDMDIAYTNTDLIKLANYVFESMRDDEVKIIPPIYDGCRYLVYANGILDVKTMVLIKPQSQPNVNGVPVPDGNQLFELDNKPCSICDMGFTGKHMHSIDFVANPAEPQYDAEPVYYDDGTLKYNTWTPFEWLAHTAGDDIAQADYIITLIGIMLVPNHSFNCFMEINGSSGSGKTTLIDIVAGIYGDKSSSLSLNHTLTEMQAAIPFRGTVNEHTNLVHVTEVNGAGLSASTISLINNFANRKMMMYQMGAKSVELTPPPLLVLDGVNWALFDNTKSGIARRLLPLDITNAKTGDYGNKDYGKDVFTQPQVITWFNWMAVNALHELTHGSDTFKFRLDNNETLPDFAREWHRMAVNAGDKLIEQFVTRIEDKLHTGYLPISLMYECYKISYMLDGGNEKYIRQERSFAEAFKMYLENDGYTIESYDTQSLKCNEEDLGIDFDMLSDDMELPDDAKNYESSKYARYPAFGWLRIVKKGGNDK